MNKIKLFSVVLALLVSLSVSAKKEKQVHGVYIAGVSASFSDSLVYFTDIQLVESAKISNSMLENREQYSAQLKDYLAEVLPSSNRTCFVYFNEKKKSLEKQIKKLRDRYIKGKAVIIKDLPKTSFEFKKAEEY